jgi:disulfide bond formation protein DsbB
VSAGALNALMTGAKVARPSCDVAAWRGLGLSMAGWNALAALGLAAVSFVAAGGRRRALERV